MNRTVFLLLCAVVLSCNRDTEQKISGYNRDNFFVVDYESILNNTSSVNLSEITDDIEYVRLETNESCLLHPRADYHFTDDYIFVDNSKYILQFDRKGKFIKQIGKPGRGPGEIGLIRIMSVLDNKKELVVQTNWARKLYYFSYDGDMIRSVPVEDVLNIKAIPGDRLVYFDNCAYGYEDYMFALLNLSGDTLDVVHNHYKWENKTGGVVTVSYHLFVPFYFYNDEILFKSMHNDTVYHVTGDSIKPEYLIDLGRYKLPQEYRAEVASSGLFEEFFKKSKDYRFCSVFEASGSLFISSTEYQEEFQYNMIYNRAEGAGKLLLDTNNDPGRIINDIDGGKDFWPSGTVNDSTVYMPVLPLDLINKDSRDELSRKHALNPQKKTEFSDMLDELNENDNPILMIVRLTGTMKH